MSLWSEGGSYSYNYRSCKLYRVQVRDVGYKLKMTFEIYRSTRPCAKRNLVPRAIWLIMWLRPSGLIIGYIFLDKKVKGEIPGSPKLLQQLCTHWLWIITTQYSILSLLYNVMILFLYIHTHTHTHEWGEYGEYSFISMKITSTLVYINYDRQSQLVLESRSYMMSLCARWYNY